ncbi:hypothetical protein [Acinetobacter baumannii]|uniref:hypothetical protein n=1 Tax=Acinetobacter baumannii TaxID=470 RepID=UPI0026FE4750|nr:hypothetical protein [Acinetobacter baumannii]
MICFIVPHDQSAVEKHNYGVEDPNIMTIVPIEEEQINTLWEINFFDELNKKFDLMISTGEDEKIVGQDKLINVLVFTEKYIKEYPHNEYLLLIKNLLQEAIEKKTELNIYL